MSNSFSGINIGLRALQTQQKSLDITGHNIANADNEEYSRQRPVHSATSPHPAPGMNNLKEAGQVGTGVEISEIQRMRDDFIDTQIQQESQTQGKWEKIADGLNRIETTFNEPTDDGLSQVMDNFWESLQDLSNDPESSAARSTVQQRGQALVDTFNSLYSQLTDYKRSLNNEVSTTVDEINSLTERIADLNSQISRIEGSGNKPNDLIDKRNQLFKELNENVNVNSNINSKNEMNISLGGVNIVRGGTHHSLDISESEPGDYEDQIIFEHTGNKANINNGELAGILEIRDVNHVIEDPGNSIDHYLDKLDEIAFNMADRFNEIHGQGYDSNGNWGEDFFDIDQDSDNTARDLELAEGIENSIDNIASGNLSENPQVANVVKGEDEDIASEALEYNYEISIQEEYGEFEYTIRQIADDPEEDDILITGTAEIEEDGVLISKEDILDNEDIEVYYDDGESEVDIEDDVGDFSFRLNSSGNTRINSQANPGSGANATALAEVFKEDEPGNLDASIMDSYDSVISTLGVKGQRANQMVENQNALLSQLENRQQSIAGVSLDEEMGNMIKYQQGYNAAARIISTTDQMLDNLMQMLR